MTDRLEAGASFRWKYRAPAQVQRRDRPIAVDRQLSHARVLRDAEHEFVGGGVARNLKVVPRAARRDRIEKRAANIELKASRRAQGAFDNKGLNKERSEARFPDGIVRERQGYRRITRQAVEIAGRSDEVVSTGGQGNTVRPKIGDIRKVRIAANEYVPFEIAGVTGTCFDVACWTTPKWRLTSDGYIITSYQYCACDGVTGKCAVRC